MIVSVSMSAGDGQWEKSAWSGGRVPTSRSTFGNKRSLFRPVTVKVKTELSRPLIVQLLSKSAKNTTFSFYSGAVSGSFRGGCRGFMCDEVGRWK